MASVGDPALTPTYQTTIGVGLSETDPGYTTRVVPALPDASGMIHRMTLRDGLLQMPPLASELPDTDGIKLIRDWIGSL